MAILNDMRGKEISEKARIDLAEIRERNFKEQQIQNAEKRKQYQVDKVKSEWPYKSH